VIARLRASERGLAEVEFVTILPLLLILAVGVVDLGRGLIAYTELEQAAQEGAIYGSFAPSDPALIETRVRTSSVGMVDMSDAAVVTVGVECPDADKKIRVRLTYTLRLVTPVVADMFGGTIQLETQSVGTNFTELPCAAS
jgi:hypothetical protein